MNSFWRCALFLLTAAALFGQSPTDASNPAAKSSRSSQQELAALLPSTLPVHAAPQSAASFYDPETLYKYMDGGADAFLLYDFQLLLHQEFRAGEADITVDIFDMKTPENAFGMYASERSPTYHYIGMGAEGYDNEGILNFLQGPYYMKLAGFGAGANAVLEQFAKAISAKIKSPKNLPADLKLLPAENRKPRTEQFLRSDPLGHPFLSPAYLARYNLAQQESTVLISIAPDAAEAQQRLQKLSAHFKSSGECKPAPEFGEGAIRGSSSFEGSVLAATKGRYTVMLVNAAPAGADDLLREALRGLP